MRKAMKAVALLLAVTVITAAFGACRSGKDPADASSPPAQPGGEITVGIAQDLDDSLDPHNMVTAGTREVLFNVFEGLVKPSADGNLIPAVASDYTVSESGDTFTFTLREGVLFHDGSAVTVGDIVYSISRASGLDTGAPLIAALAAVDTVEAEDDKTVVIKTKEPNLEFLAYLTAPIIPEGSGEGMLPPAGTGPFRFVSRSPQESIIIERFDGYWGETARLEKVTFRVIDNAETLMLSLKSGAIDLCMHLTSSQVNELDSGMFDILEGSMNLVQAVYLNHEYEPLSNADVRRAMAHAINRGEIMMFLADGRGSALGSSMYPAFSKYFMPELTDYYDYNPDEARRLLSEAGYGDGFSLEITVPSNYQPHIDTAEVVVEQLRSVGINATIDLVEWATWLSEAYNGRNFQATVVGLTTSSGMTARDLLDRFGSESAKNFINFSSEEYDEVLSKAASAASDAEQTEYYKRLQKILTEEAANLYIQDLSDMVAIKTGLDGFRFYPLYVLDLSGIYYTA